jgi:Acetyltransferase (GNAT) domain
MIAAACRAALEMLKQRGWRATLCGVEQVELQASGFRLRPWRDDDAPAVLLAVRDPAIARWNPVDRPDPDLRVAQAWVEDRGDWTGSEHASFAVVTADDDALFVQVMRVGSYPDRTASAQRRLKRSALSGWLKLPTRAGDLGRSPFNGIAEYVGPAPAAAVVGVVVVPAVNAVVVGGFGPTGGGVAHRKEGTGPHWLASITSHQLLPTVASGREWGFVLAAQQAA